MREKISLFIVRHRVLVFLVFLACSTAFSLGAFRIKTEVILSHLFPHDHPYLKLHARFSQIFGSGGSAVVIAVKVNRGNIFNQKTLTKVKQMTGEIELWDEVYRILTVSIASNSVKVVNAKAKGEITIDQLMFPDVPKTQEEMELLKKNIFSNPSYNGTLVSRDGSAALIFTEFKENISYERAFGVLRSLVQRYSDDETSIHIVGYPMLMGWIYSFKKQMYLVFATTLVMMIMILFVSFRNLVGMVAPLSNVAICTGLGLGFIGWIGINFSPLSYVLAFLVGARMLSNAVQITHRYIEEFKTKGNKEEATYETMRTMMMPNWAAVATDAAGFLVLILVQIVLMQQIAVIMSFWMMTIILEGVLVPLICSFVPLKNNKCDVNKERERDYLAKINMVMARVSMGSGRYLVWTVVASILVIGIWQTSRIKIGDPTPGSPILWPEHTYNQDQALIDDLFDASSDNFVLYYEGAPESVYDPAVLRTFEEFTYHMANRLPDLYKSSNSIIDMAKIVNLTLRDGDQFWYQLPRNEEQLTGLFGYIRNAVGTATLQRYIDGSLKRAQITLFFSDHTSENLQRIRNAAFEFFKDHPMKLEKGEFLLAGGRMGMEIALNEEMKQSHAEIDAMVYLAVFVLCIICFRSVVGGLMLALPLILANLTAFAYMGIMDIGLTVNTLPIAAVAVGVGVDFAIYLYSRCKEEFPRQQDWNDTIMTAIRTAGKGVVLTGVTLIIPLFTWYFISGLKFQAQMGFFLALLLFINMVAALTLHLLLIWVIKPRFMTMRAIKKENNTSFSVPENKRR